MKFKSSLEIELSDIYLEEIGRSIEIDKVQNIKFNGDEISIEVDIDLTFSNFELDISDLIDNYDHHNRSTINIENLEITAKFEINSRLKEVEYVQLTQSNFSVNEYLIFKEIVDMNYEFSDFENFDKSMLDQLLKKNLSTALIDDEYGLEDVSLNYKLTLGEFVAN